MITPTFVLPIAQPFMDISNKTNTNATDTSSHGFDTLPDFASMREKSITEKLSRRPSLLQFFEEAVRNQSNDANDDSINSSLLISVPSKLKRRRIAVEPKAFTSNPVMSLLNPRRVDGTTSTNCTY